MSTINIYFNNKVFKITNSIQRYNKRSDYYIKSPLFDKNLIAEIWNEFLYNKKCKQVCLLVNSPKEVLECIKKDCSFLKASGGVVYNKKKQILLIKRNLIWDLPKGKIEENESNKKAALREVMEETGLMSLKIENKLVHTFHVYFLINKPVLKETIWYKMSSGKMNTLVPQQEEGITKVAWKPKDKAIKLLSNSYKSFEDLIFLI